MTEAYNAGATIGGGGSMPPESPALDYQNRLKRLIDNPGSFSGTPGFRYALDTGRQAVERSMAARGLGNSGNLLTALMQQGVGMAQQDYGNEVDRLSGLSTRANSNGGNWWAPGGPTGTTQLSPTRGYGTPGYGMPSAGPYGASDPSAPPRFNVDWMAANTRAGTAQPINWGDPGPKPMTNADQMRWS